MYTIKCKYCGFISDSQLFYCGKCGKPFDKCHSCGKTIPSDSAFCPCCGNKCKKGYSIKPVLEEDYNGFLTSKCGKECTLVRFKDSEEETITIPDTVTVIGKSAFCSSSLKEIIVPTSVKRIEEKAFYECEILLSILIPPSVTYIGNNAFPKNSWMRKLKVRCYKNSVAQQYAIQNGYATVLISI